jgi:hypothetical protein
MLMNDVQQEIRPVGDLAALAPLIGTWELSGDTSGTVTYEWMEGGHFLIQRFDMTLFDHDVKGVEMIGHLRPFGEAPSEELRSRAYDADGNTLDYVYEMADGVLTIWGGEKGSTSYCTATFSEDGTSSTGAWTYPGGGGYTSNMTRVGDR